MADEPIIKRVRSEFQEMPGLQLTDDSRYRLSTSDPIRQPVRQKSVKADAPAPRRRNRDHAA